MKAPRIESLDDIIHDFKNPAIATACFARRLKQLIGQDGSDRKNSKIEKYVDIFLEETSNLLEMASSFNRLGTEQIVNLNNVIKKRFEINRETVKEQLKQNVTLQEIFFMNPYISSATPFSYNGSWITF